MSDNSYNSQTPNSDNQRPDYTYSWNGSEHNGNRRSTGRLISIVSILLVLAVIITLSAVNVFYRLNESDGENDELLNSDFSDMSQTSDLPNTPEKPKDEKNDYSVPEFVPSADSELDLSNDLTKLYSACSPSCCTIRVSVGGTPYSIGSGFVIDAENGYIATNHHVIDSGDTVEVIFYNGEEYTAEVVGSNATTDLAVLKIEAEGLTEVEFGNSNNIQVGETVIAIGTPYDESLAGTMTSGIISGVARGVDITNEYGTVVKTMTLIQTDCSINPGNSGGPLIDMAGNVIGITSLKLVDEQFEGIGFAIPITDALEIFQKLIAGEDITGSDIATATPRIGITVYELESGLEYFGIRPRCEYPEGVLVGSIEYSSSAYKAGLSGGDIITKFEGTSISAISEMDEAMKGYSAGDQVTIEVFRFNRTYTKGEYVEITFTLDAAQ